MAPLTTDLAGAHVRVPRLLGTALIRFQELGLKGPHRAVLLLQVLSKKRLLEPGLLLLRWQAYNR